MTPQPIALPLIDGDTLLFDNSGLEPFQTCPRAAEYSVCRRLRATGDRAPLKFGGIAHKVLEARYRSCNPFLEQTPEIEKVMVAVAEEGYKGKRLVGVEKDGTLTERWEGGWTPPEDDYRTFSTMVTLIRKYGEAYPMENFDIVKFPDGRPFVEVPFALPLGTIEVNADIWVQDIQRTPDGSLIRVGLPALRSLRTLNIVWQGRIDLVHEYNNATYVLDHKTSSMATNMAEFEISHQFKGYEWAVETLLGREVAGTIINRSVVRKPTKTGEGFTFERKLIPTQRGLITEWKTDILHIIADFVEGVRRSYLPKHTVWCVGKFGTCQFHKVCSNDDSAQREFLLESGEYEENTWSPLKEGV